MLSKHDADWLIVVYIVVACHVCCGNCLECYSCSNVSHVAQCQSVVQCPVGHICHKSVASGTYTLGCKASDTCNLVSSSPGGSGSIVGRSMTSSRRSTASSDDCSECCETGMCNRQLCQNNGTYLECHDTGHVDCQGTGTYLDLCSEMGHSKKECRRFCGLCSMVDGGWSSWSPWSSCSTTCGNGKEIRTRSCSNPAPADGGTDCTGATSDSRVCSHDHCPDGGADCTGATSDSRVCTNSPFPVDGGWSTWSVWGTCSVSCGVGMKHRTRTCSSPSPAHYGLNCLGTDTDDNVCIPGACQDGLWSTWGAWSSCSATCGDCIQKRHRSCTGQKVGKVCVGDNMDVKINHLNSCIDTNIGFTAYGPRDTGRSGHLTFAIVVTNLGGGYNIQTGEFTCRVAGLYTFSLTLTTSGTPDYVRCSIYKNSVFLGKMYVDPSPGTGGTPGSTTVYVHLAAGDKVYLGDCSSAANMGGNTSSFTGFLVHVD